MSDNHPAPKLPPEALTLAWQSASLLLGYPDEQLLSQAPLLREASHRLPDDIGGRLRRYLDHLEATPLAELATDYVATFDQRKRCCLFLTYFVHGDTRKRGMALLRFKQLYLQHGLELLPEELPDHLCVVLEFGATASVEDAWTLLLDHRAGLEVLRMALRDSGSAWTPVVEAVTGTLPPLQGSEQDAVLRLATQGPPDEEVGLSGYGGPVMLPMPTTGARS